MNHQIAHSGVWALAVIMIVVVSWFFYRYLAPKTWHEWAGAGLVQAFIIALYAEMYGFPLTIYLLVRWFGLDRKYLNANLWSTLLGIGETGMMISMILGYFLVFVGITLFAQGWRELYKAHQEKRLSTSGLYGIVRHPQYTGLFLALFGEGIVHWPTIFSVGLFPLIVLAYVLLARKEERRMVEEFGEAYRVYQRQVPMFIPLRAHWRVGQSRATRSLNLDGSPDRAPLAACNGPNGLASLPVVREVGLRFWESGSEAIGENAVLRHRRAAIPSWGHDPSMPAGTLIEAASLKFGPASPTHGRVHQCGKALIGSRAEKLVQNDI